MGQRSERIGAIVVDAVERRRGIDIPENPNRIGTTRRENRLFQAAQSIFLEAGNPQSIMLFPVGMFRQIALI